MSVTVKPIDYRAGYTGEDDAERMLEHDLKRQNWGIDVRDALAGRLRRIVAREIHTADIKNEVKERAATRRRARDRERIAERED